MNERPAVSARASVARLLSSWSLARTSTSRRLRPGRSPAASASRSALAHPSSSASAFSGQLVLRDEAAGAALRDQLPVVAGVAARDEHDGRTGAVVAASLDRRRSRPCRAAARRAAARPAAARGRPRRARSVLGLADHLEPFRLEDRPRRRPEARVVVDDDYGLGHGSIVAEEASGVSAVNHTVFGRSVRASERLFCAQPGRF